MSDPKPTRGGAREGAGRKPSGRDVTGTWRISTEAAANIKAKAAQLGISESALVDKWGKRLKT